MTAYFRRPLLTAYFRRPLSAAPSSIVHFRPSNNIFFSFEEHLFHESISIRGVGEKPDDVIIQSEEGEGYFVFCDSENIFFENLTLEGRRNFEGALVVNGGKCNLINVNISCDMVTRGIIVRPFAVCKGNG